MQSILVVDDHDASTVRWAPQARYFLVDPHVTGAASADASVLGMHFDIGVRVASRLTRTPVDESLCASWYSVDFHSVGNR